MLENFKSVILVLLVVLSVILTGRLWLGSYQYEIADEPTSERIEFGEKPGLFAQVSPEKIYFKREVKGYNRDEEENDLGEEDLKIYGWNKETEAYDKIWSLLREELMDVLLTQDQNLEIYEKKRSVEKTDDYRMGSDEVFGGDKENDLDREGELESYQQLVIDFPYELGGILKNDNINTSLMITDDLDDIHRMVLHLNEELVIEKISFSGCERDFIVVESGVDYDREILSKKLEDAGYFDDSYLQERFLAHVFYENFFENNDVKEFIYNFVESEMNLEGISPGDIFSFNLELECGNEIFWSQEKDVFSPKYIEYEEIEKEKLAKAFFHDLSFVRKIDEWDGGIIYTDGQRGLRFLPGGGFEYDAPKGTRRTDVDETEFTDVIRQSGEYISLYGGWVDNLYLNEIKVIDDEYTYESDKFKASYRYSYKGYPIINLDPVEINFDFQGVYNYMRKVPEHIKVYNSSEQEVKDDLTEPKSIIVDWLKEELEREMKTSLEENPEKLEKLLEELGYDEDLEENSDTIEVTVNIDEITRGFFVEDDRNKDTMIPVIMLENNYGQSIFNAMSGARVK